MNEIFAVWTLISNDLTPVERTTQELDRVARIAPLEAKVEFIGFV